MQKIESTNEDKNGVKSKDLTKPDFDSNQFRLTEAVLREKHSVVSDTSTPSFYVKEKGGFDYVDEAYMRHQLNKHYPLWNWEIKEWKFLGDKSIVIHGKLTIIDHGVTRNFDSVAAHRVAINKQTGDYVDIGNDLKAANSDCFKVAVNRLCNVADDVYRKRVEDISLNDKQKEEIQKLLKSVKDERAVNRVNYTINSGDINSRNFDRSIERLKSMIEGEK